MTLSVGYKMEKDYFLHESSYVDDGVQIGKDTKIWHFSHIQKGSVIGENCTLGQNVNIGVNVKIGNNCKIQNNVSVYEGVELKDYVFCGPSMVFTNVTIPRCKYSKCGSAPYKKTIVGEGASIGANATIVCGHNIGKHAFIAAGAVVACNVPDYALMMGVPAKRKAWVCECGEILKKEENYTCSKCKRTYVEKDDTLTEASIV
jgi:UDP-2-acetamido-3-amino-2,3-dideoxy-glucuronate N-acetyltransferase